MICSGFSSEADRDHGTVKWGIDTINVHYDFVVVAWVSVSITVNHRIVSYKSSLLF